MFKKLLAVLSLVSVVTVTTGCKDSSQGSGAGGACGSFTACGGDVVGQWKVKDMCFDDPQAITADATNEPECRTIRSFDLHASGTYQFTADGNAVADVRFTIDMDAVWTGACLTAVAKGAAVDLAATCTRLKANYAQNPKFAGASCMVEGTACSYIITSVENHSTRSGPYTIKGNTLNEEDGSSTYCVEGSALESTAPAPTAAAR